MKQGWEIKKLGEVCEILDHLRVPITKKDRREGIYPYYGASGVQDYVDSYIFDGRYLLVGEDGAKWGANDKSAYIIEGRSWVNNHAHILKINDGISDRMVEYYLVFKDLQEYVTGAVVPKLTQQALRNIPIPIPSREEQERIVEILDREFEKIDALKENADKNLQHAKDLFQSALKQKLQPKEGWATKTIRELSEELFAGGDVPKHAFSKTITSEYNVPIYANAVEQDGLYGYTNTARVNKASITIAGRGSGTGYIIERNEKYLPIVRLIVVVPQTQIVKNRFLYYALKSLDIKSNVSAIPQLTAPMIAQYKVNYPTLAAQDVIIGVLDKLSKNCRTLEENYTKTIALCDDMKQALLRKAFNGEL